MTSPYEEHAPTRDEVNGWNGPVLLEFGADWCEHCQAAQPLVCEVLAEVAGVRHVKIADGKGKQLGRSFAVKLWPTLIFLKDGKEIARAVRPSSVDEIRRGIEALIRAG